MKTKLYIAGAGGMLGEAFHRVFNDDYLVKFTDCDVNERWLEFLDFRDNEKYREDVINFKPDYLFHLGAHTNLEYCELYSQDAYLTNSDAVKTAVSISNSLNIPLLYISTAGIYDGTKDSYDERDVPNPLGHYAKSKYMAEKYVIEHANKYIICRAGWMMGGGPSKDKKFVNNLIKQINAGHRELYIVNDKYGTPTFTIDFAKNVRLLIENQSCGLYNMVCEGEASRICVARELLRLLNLEDTVTVIPVTSEHFKNEYFANRPSSERLINRRLNMINKNIMGHWKTALREYLTIYYADMLKNTTVASVAR